jgi:hypothetical protein
MVETKWLSGLSAEATIVANRRILEYPEGYRTQIIPSIGVHVGVGPSAGKVGILVYLIFEHPWMMPTGADMRTSYERAIRRS